MGCCPRCGYCDYCPTCGRRWPYAYPYWPRPWPTYHRPWVVPYYSVAPSTTAGAIGTAKAVLQS